MSHLASASHPDWWIITETEHGPITVCLILGAIAVVNLVRSLLK